MTSDPLLILGEHHAAWQSLSVLAAPGGRTVAATSVGGEYVRRCKGHRPVPNEDAGVAVEQGDRTLLAVCDAHCGHWSSHSLATAVARAATTVPSDPASLHRLVAALALGQLPPDHPEYDDVLDSESTLTIAVVDRSANRLFGISYGDSSVFVLPASGPARRCVDKGLDYISPWQDRLPPPDGQFDLCITAGEVVLVCTDGVDECHYDQPATSIGPSHLGQLRCACGQDLPALARAIGALALRGVDGHPGGQDNLTLLVSGW